MIPVKENRLVDAECSKPIFYLSKVIHFDKKKCKWIKKYKINFDIITDTVQFMVFNY